MKRIPAILLYKYEIGRQRATHVGALALESVYRQNTQTRIRNHGSVREAAKSHFLMALPLREGWGDNGRVT